MTFDIFGIDLGVSTALRELGEDIVGGQLRMGDDLVVEPQNWMAQSHQQLYDGVNQGNEPSTGGEAEAAWSAVGADLVSVADILNGAIGTLTSGWRRAESAAAAQSAMTELVQWSEDSVTASNYLGNRMGEQTSAAQTARDSMSAPVAFDPQATFNQALTQYGNRAERTPPRTAPPIEREPTGSPCAVSLLTTSELEPGHGRPTARPRFKATAAAGAPHGCNELHASPCPGVADWPDLREPRTTPRPSDTLDRVHHDRRRGP